MTDEHPLQDTHRERIDAHFKHLVTTEEAPLIDLFDESTIGYAAAYCAASLLADWDVSDGPYPGDVDEVIERLKTWKKTIKEGDRK